MRALEPSANRITLLRGIDAAWPGTDSRTEFLAGLNSPFGMALVGEDFYVANTDALLKYHYSPSRRHASGRTGEQDS